MMFRKILIWGFIPLIFMTGLLLQAGQTLASEPLKIGYIDAQKVLESSAIGKKAKSSLQEYVQSREKVLELERLDLKTMEEELIKQGALLSGDAKRKKQQEFQGKAERFQRKLMEMNREVQEKQIDLVRSFRKELEVVVRKVAKKEGYNLVLDRDAEAGPIIYADKGFDLTPLVIGAMDKKSP